MFLISCKSSFKFSSLFSKLTFNVLFTRSIIWGILSLFSFPTAVIHLPNCCIKSILEFLPNGLSQIIPSTSSTWTPSFNISITNINFFFFDFDELNSAKDFLLLLLPFSESIVYDSTSLFILFWIIAAILESSNLSQSIYSVIVSDKSLDSVWSALGQPFIFNLLSNNIFSFSLFKYLISFSDKFLFSFILL